MQPRVWLYYASSISCNTNNCAADCTHGNIDTVSVVKRSRNSVGLEREGGPASDSEYLAVSRNI